MRSLGYVLLVVGLLLLSVVSVLGCELVEGRVLDALTGTGLSEAVVTCGANVTRVDADGRFAVYSHGVPLRIRAAGYRRVEVPPEQATEITLDPFTPKALYLSFYGISAPSLRNPALELIKNTELNALVIDIKGDRGMVSYPSQVALATEIGAQKVITVRDPKALLASLQQRGIYTIGRIVVFKDDLLAGTRPELAVKNPSGAPWRDGEKLRWVDPFASEVWEYNIALAEEAAALGFDEIQFDYMRFPERAGLVFSRENIQANRVEAITGFLAAARKRLSPYNVALAGDIFGYVCWNENDTNIGQQLECLAEHLDYISPMLYPSGFSSGVGRYHNPVANPYEIISLSLNKAQQRTGLSALRFRPWLQAFRDYAFDRRHFGASEIHSQTSASDEFGSNGWMLWNPRNVYSSAGLKEKRTDILAELKPTNFVR
ncbi:MAG: putative glycoside hydrolase [Desulfuromonadaceae bacterium]